MSVVLGKKQGKSVMPRASRSIWRQITRNKMLYLLILPALIYYAVFAYYPMYGITLAFKQYMFNKGIVGSPWVGMSNFQQLFQDP